MFHKEAQVFLQNELYEIDFSFTELHLDLLSTRIFP